MEIKIGILLPKSDMFPSLAIDILNGLKLCLNKEDEFQFVPKYLIESIGNATDFGILERVERMLLAEETDVIICFCSDFLLDSLITIANSYRKPLIHITLGARVLKSTHISPYVLHLSLNVCATNYLAGQYAATHFGKKGALLSSFYDGGYQLSESFFQGFTDHGGEIVFNYVSPLDYKTESFDAMIEGLEAAKPETIFLVFSYKEGNKVFSKLRESGLDAIPSMVIPLMVDESQEIANDTIQNVYSVASWAFNEELEILKQFNSDFKNTYEKRPTIFGLLGYEAGTVLMHCLQEAKTIPAQLGAYFKNKTLRTLRGELYFTNYHESIPQYFRLRKLEISEGHYQNISEAVLDSTLSEMMYDKMEPLPYTGWKNPYICT